MLLKEIILHVQKFIKKINPSESVDTSYDSTNSYSAVQANLAFEIEKSRERQKLINKAWGIIA